MKTKSILAMVALFVFALCINSFAQGGPGGQRMSPEERAKQQLKNYTEQLKLTDAQVKKIEVLLKAQNDEIQKMRDANAGGDMQAMREKFTKMREETNTKIEKLLTKDQVVSFKKMLEDQRQRMQQRMQQGGGGQ